MMAHPETAVVCGLLTAVLLSTCCSAMQMLQAVNASGANSVKFTNAKTPPGSNSTVERLFTQITTDLHRFTKTGIHLDMIEQPYCSEREPSKCTHFSILQAQMQSQHKSLVPTLVTPTWHHHRQLLFVQVSEFRSFQGKCILLVKSLTGHGLKAGTGMSSCSC